MSLDGARWRRLSELFEQALDAAPAPRAAVLRQAQAEDPTLAAELERMLAAADIADTPLDAPAARNLPGRDEEEDTMGPLRLGSWLIEHELGRGGMGVVYAAHRDDDTEQRAAVKLLRRRWDGSPQAQRFLHERRILASLTHPHIPRLIDHGLDAEGRPWFAQEFIAGQDLLAFADAHGLDLRARLELFRRVCDAVQHAHAHFVVHRDLKPSNILVDAEGHPYVLDFGVAKRTDLAEDATRTGLFAGFTPQYAAPEQVAGGMVTAATDVYALGVLLYQLLSGRLPYAVDAGNLRQASEAITSRDPLPLERAIGGGNAAEVRERLRRRGISAEGFRRFVRGDLARIVQTALAKEPPRRYASVGLLSADLKRFLSGRPVSVSGNTFGYHARKFVRRNRWAVALGLLAGIAILVGTGTSLVQMRKAKVEAAAARQAQVAMLRVLEQVGSTRANRDVASAILEAGRAELRKIPAESQVRRELADALVVLLRERGHGRQADTLTESELGPRISGHGLRDRHDLAMLATYATSLAQRGEVTRGRQALATALAQWPQVDSEERASALKTASMIELVANRPDASHVYARSAYDMRVRLAGPEGVDAMTTVEYAASLTAQRRGEEARQLTEALLERRFAANRNVEHAGVLVMAALRRSLFGDFLGADALYRQAHELMQGMDASYQDFLLFSDAVNRFDLGELVGAARFVRQLQDSWEGELQAGRLAGGYAGPAELHWLEGELALAQEDAATAVEAFATAARMLDREARLEDAQTGAPHQRAYLHALHAIAVRPVAPSVADAALERAQALAAHPGVVGTYAQAMTEAARGHALLAQRRPAQAAEAFVQAQAVLPQSRRKPLVLEFQLKENRDALRFAVWEAQAWQAAGAPRRAELARARAMALAAGNLGIGHPYATALRQQAPSEAARR